MFSNRTIAQRYKVSRRTVDKMRLCFELFGQPYPPKGVRRGRPPRLTLAQEEAFLRYVQSWPDAYADEMAWWIFDNTGHVFSDRGVLALLLRHQWSRKVARAIAGERNEALRAHWRAKSAGWLRENIVFVDESACNERNGYR